MNKKKEQQKNNKHKDQKKSDHMSCIVHSTMTQEKFEYIYYTNTKKKMKS